jgi:hypothetical protein
MRRVPILCLETGCPARVWEDGQSRCPDHRSSSGWARRPRVSRQAAGYGAEWERLRRRHLAAHPVCVDCGATTDLQVDHVREFTAWVTPSASTRRTWPHAAAGATPASPGAQVAGSSSVAPISGGRSSGQLGGPDAISRPTTTT